MPWPAFHRASVTGRRTACLGGKRTLSSWVRAAGAEVPRAGTRLETRSAPSPRELRLEGISTGHRCPGRPLGSSDGPTAPASGLQQDAPNAPPHPPHNGRDPGRLSPTQVLASNLAVAPPLPDSGPCLVPVLDSTPILAGDSGPRLRPQHSPRDPALAALDPRS